MCLDAHGNFYTADCHSSPIYQLIRDAYYPSFGKPHDGMGLRSWLSGTITTPPACAALCSTSPPTGRRSFATTSSLATWLPAASTATRLTGAAAARRASSARPNTHERPLVPAGRPSVRPGRRAVHRRLLQPHHRLRGALDHLGRDCEMGRIWRLIYRGQEARRLAKPVDPTAAPLGQAIAELSSPLLTRRMAATDYLADDIGAAAASRLARRFRRADASPELKAHGAWVLTLAKLDEATLLRLAGDNSRSFAVTAGASPGTKTGRPGSLHRPALATIHRTSAGPRRTPLACTLTSTTSAPCSKRWPLCRLTMNTCGMLSGSPCATTSAPSIDWNSSPI